MQAERTPRRTKDGSYVVEVDELRVGDRLRLTGGGSTVWWPILRIEEKPKTRRMFVGVKSSGQVVHGSLMRRTTLVARAPREDEIAAAREGLRAGIQKMIEKPADGPRG